MHRRLVHLSRLASLLVVLTTSFYLGQGSARAMAAGAGIGYWHTSGTHIVDADNHPVRITGVTWYGMETANWVPDGLDFQRYTTIMDEVKLLGYNTIRLPFSNELVEQNPVVQHSVAANRALRGKRALDVLDAIVSYAHQIGIKIILDNHRSHASRPLEVNNLDEPLWYTTRYSEGAWIRDWQLLARRYAQNDAVIGFDLRNEPHTGGAGPWNLHAYLHQGATWGPYGGITNRATDWRGAAQRAGNAVLSVNPRLLIIVEGIQMYPDKTAPGGVDASWWSGVLTPAKRYPVRLRVAHRLVYSAHDWGPQKWQMPWFTHLSDASLRAAWHKRWSFLLDQPDAPDAAPLWVGEFGTCNNKPGCVRSSGQQGAWFQGLLRFLRERPEVSWSFFALDGTNSNDCLANNGLLNASWNRVASAELQRALVTAGAGPMAAGVALDGKAPLIPGSEITRKPRDPHSRLCLLP